MADMTQQQEGEPKAIEELSFKEASIELEQIVRALEAGDLELEESLARFSRAQALLASLRERLVAAEQQVQVLLDETEGAVADTTSAPATAFLDE